MDSDYNSTLNGKTGYSKIADPYVNELDQLWLSYAGIPDTLIKGGRQVIKLDDDRLSVTSAGGSYNKPMTRC